MMNKINQIIKKINIYFIFIALAASASSYLLLVENTGKHSAEIDILVSPKNIKTSFHLNDIKENIVIIAEKNSILGKDTSLKIDKKGSLIEIVSVKNTKEDAVILAENSARKVANLASKYYDIKRDLNLEIVYRDVKMGYFKNLLVILESIIIGLGVSFIIQLILDLVEKIILTIVRRKKTYKSQRLKTKNELDNFFKINREKIQKLSTSFSAENKMHFKQNVNVDNFENQNYKKASSPFNLPIAQEDLNKIIQSEKNESAIELEIGGDQLIAEKEEQGLKDDFIFEQESLSNDELQNVFGEPTEEEFKKRLNQLLGNK